eukprot:GFUD01020449.1.p1 GENE.GFUD01020449.1~~GFUD01020449.1.p1  ORF type:complete len:280 (-),score=66.78 GFUD01020449.1:72-911(-)
MAKDEKFCLRWNNFENNISIGFRELRDDKDFFDVTLACDDKQLQAHKVILSACSPFFRSVLKKNPHQHPLLYLKGVKYEDIFSVLNFMYHGEVNVAQEELNSFLTVAKDLQVKGLTQTGEKDQPTKPSNRSSSPMPAAKRYKSEHSLANIPLPVHDKPRMRPSYEHVLDRPATGVTPLAREIKDLAPVIKTEAPVIDVDCDKALYSDPLLVQQSSDFPAEHGGYDGGYEYQQSGGYEEQVGHMGNTSQEQTHFPCDFCEKSFGNKNSYYDHIQKHKGRT